MTDDRNTPRSSLAIGDWSLAIRAQRAWGRGLRNAVGRWYVSREANDLAHQAVKFQQRDGWSHADLLRLAHPIAPSRQHDAVFRWMLTGADSLGERFRPRLPLSSRWPSSRGSGLQNQRKADRLPHEAGLKLLSVPRAPKELPVTAILRNTHGLAEWKLFLNE